MTTNYSERRIPIKDMESLDREIAHLKMKCRQIESKFDENIDQLKDNYAVMAFNSVVGNRLKNVPFVGEIANAALNNKKLQQIIENLIETAIDKTSGLIDKIASKLQSKKKEE